MSETSDEKIDQLVESPILSSSSALLGLFQPPGEAEVIDTVSKQDDSVTLPKNETALQNSLSHDDHDSPTGSLTRSNVNAPAGSLSHFMRLFAPLATSDQVNNGIERAPFASSSNRSSSLAERRRDLSETDPLLDCLSTTTRSSKNLHTPRNSLDWRDHQNHAELTVVGIDTPKAGRKSKSFLDTAENTVSENKNVVSSNSKLSSSHSRLMTASHVRMPSAVMPQITEGLPENTLLLPNLNRSHNGKQYNLLSSNESPAIMAKCLECCTNTAQVFKQPSTYIGSFMYLLYHVVFCLALGSAIMRPNNPTSVLGLMTRTAALGTIFASPVYWLDLSSEIPALYPTADLFLAPFLAGLAVIVDQTLADDPSVTKEENDAVFLATFGVLTATGFYLCSILLVAASIFKLANLGSFLPFPVICGFFSAVGILTWTLAINVDTGGKSIGAILSRGDTALMIFALKHHIPTLVVAGFMKYLGPKNPFYVVMVVFVTIGLFYLSMLITGTSLEEMKNEGWFWSHDELIYEHSAATIGFSTWSPPAPFGVIVELHRVHWGAVRRGFSTTVALSFLYLIRCSVHGVALKKNVPNLSRKVRSDDPILEKNRSSVESDESKNKPFRTIGKPPAVRSRMFSEAVDIEAVMQSLPVKQHAIDNSKEENDKDERLITYQAKPTVASLKMISLTYGKSQVLTALVGGFAITPSVAASSTMFSLGAEGLAPQVGSVILLFAFYMSDFRIVGYIPKPAFSAMLVLSFFDMIYTWFYKSYFKTKDKLEWLVVPAIVVCSFVLDLLSAVFLGIGVSTLIFVAAFFRSGVVKYVANGKCIHSTIERPFRMSEWLDEEGDKIQVLCLQNYLFFGNASSVYSYIAASFDPDPSTERKLDYLILDLTLVTGMDTSTVDVFADIRNLCRSKKCKLLMAGMSPAIRSILSLGNFKPDTGIRSKRQLRFFPDLDSALGKAEDMLLETYFVEWEPKPSCPDRRRLFSDRMKENGFRTALSHIGAEHGSNFSMNLTRLQEYTTKIELKAGEILYEDGESKNIERGLFFIEAGVLKVEHLTNQTATRGSLGSMKSFSSINGVWNGGGTLQGIPPRSFGNSPTQTFRLARIGVGWVAGTMEFFHCSRFGNQVALDCCKLHHLPFSKIQIIEEKDPELVLSLYKLLSYLMARRQEATIKQLATLHSIMMSPPRWQSLRKPSSNLKPA